MPYPTKNEKHDKYMERCLSNKEMNTKFPDAKQRYAVCQSYWDNRNKAKAEIVNNSIEITFPQVELEDEI